MTGMLCKEMARISESPLTNGAFHGHEDGRVAPPQAHVVALPLAEGVVGVGPVLPSIPQVKPGSKVIRGHVASNVHPRVALPTRLEETEIYIVTQQIKGRVTIALLLWNEAAMFPLTRGTLLALYAAVSSFSSRRE